MAAGHYRSDPYYTSYGPYGVGVAPWYCFYPYAIILPYEAAPPHDGFGAPAPPAPAPLDASCAAPGGAGCCDPAVGAGCYLWAGSADGPTAAAGAAAGLPASDIGGYVPALDGVGAALDGGPATGLDADGLAGALASSSFQATMDSAYVDASAAAACGGGCGGGGCGGGG
jgi:hypothetical protein